MSRHKVYVQSSSTNFVLYLSEQDKQKKEKQFLKGKQLKNEKKKEIWIQWYRSYRKMCRRYLVQ